MGYKGGLILSWPLLRACVQRYGHGMPCLCCGVGTWLVVLGPGSRHTALCYSWRRESEGRGLSRQTARDRLHLNTVDPICKSLEKDSSVFSYLSCDFWTYAVSQLPSLIIIVIFWSVDVIIT